MPAIDLSGSADGTSQRGRRAAALDPATAPIDERSTADLLAFVQAYVQRLRDWRVDAAGALVDGGDWQPLSDGTVVGLSPQAIAAAMEAPALLSAEQQRWLGRPHFALLLCFLELLAHARDQLNRLTARHLDHHYLDILGMQPLQAEPDRAHVLFRLSPRAAELRLPAGTAVDAGRDGAGMPQVYRTERDLVVNHAQVVELRSVFVDRHVVGVAEAGIGAGAVEALEAKLRLALGEPAPGDAVPRWRNKSIDHAFVVSLRAPLDLCRTDRGLYLAPHEFRTLIRLVRRRDAGLEWARINALLGNPNPARPRDFMANLALAIHPEVLDFANDGLDMVNDVDDLFKHALTVPAVRDYIQRKLRRLDDGLTSGFAKFMEVMPLKQQVDRDWAAANTLLERAARRLRNAPGWQFNSIGFDPAALEQNLETALDGSVPAWPWQTGSVRGYDAALRSLEDHLGLSIERLDTLVTFAESLHGGPAQAWDWTATDRMLADAHRERAYSRRRAALENLRAGRDSQAAFDILVNEVLRPLRQRADAPPFDWPAARALLQDQGGVAAGNLADLEAFRAAAGNPALQTRLGWPDVIALLEIAGRQIEHLPEPVAQQVTWRGLYPWPDARAALVHAASTRWRLFGGLPPFDAQAAPEPLLGWALRAPVLALSSGNRRIDVTIGLVAQSFVRTIFLRALTGSEAEPTGDQLLLALGRVLVVQLSSAKGWMNAELTRAQLARGTPSDDYWSLDGVPRLLTESDRPALQLQVRLAADRDAVAPLPGDTQPTVRVLLRPQAPADSASLQQWTTQAQPFEPLRVAAVRVSVDVDELKGVQLQQDERPLDARKAVEPFGRAPAVGARLYFSHPELVRHRLTTLSLNILWSGLPASAAYYTRYSPVITRFQAELALVERNIAHPLDAVEAVFGPAAASNLNVVNLPGTLDTPSYVYAAWPRLLPADDLRTAERCWRLELLTDLGHAAYPALATLFAGKLAAQIATAVARTPPGTVTVEDFQVNPPYTPLARQFRVGYSARVELKPVQDGAPGPDGQLLHVHPFGTAQVGAHDPTLLPRYDDAGELYIGLRGLVLPQHLTLLMQLADGSSNPDRVPTTVRWSCLSGDHWLPVDVVDDATRGLLNSGIVELALPDVLPATLLPAGLVWLRATIPEGIDAVCDCVAIHAQAVCVRHHAGAGATAGHALPLPAGSITRLVAGNARVADVEQPYASFGGRPAEAGSAFHTRVSERLRHRQRALSVWDVERLVLQRFAQLYKVKCLPAHPAPGAMTVLVIPDLRQDATADAKAPKAPASLLEDIQAYLAQRAPAGADIDVRNPRYVPVQLRLAVRFRAGTDENFARRQLNEDLQRHLAPWAYDDGAELMIGGRIHANSIVDFVDRRDDVDYLGDIKLFRVVDGGEPLLVPPVPTDYHIATLHADEVLVSAQEHHIDVVPAAGWQQANYTGIDYMKVQLDFIVHA